jgi:putative hydrolase of the HAD superfamily
VLIRRDESAALLIKAVLFDFGGTLVNTGPRIDCETVSLVHLHKALRNHGVTVLFEEYKRAHHEVWRRIIRRGSLREIAFSSRVVETLSKLGYSFQPTDKLIVDATEAFMKPWIQARIMDEAVPSVLGRLKKMYKLGVVSNSSWSPAVWKTLERFKISGCFDGIVVSVDVGWRKPSPKIFRKALQKFGVTASETVFVGDELDDDVEGAQRVGMHTVWLRNPSSAERISRIKPDYTISQIRELLSVLRRLEHSGV